MMKKYVMMLGVMIMSVSVVTGCANKNDQKSAVEQTTSSAVQSQTAAERESHCRRGIYSQKNRPLIEKKIDKSTGLCCLWVWLRETER